MKGRKNSVISRIMEAQPHVMDIGCICHLANLCCKAGVKTIPYAIDEMLVDIFYHFHHSAKRKEQYSEFLEFTEVEPLKILKHSTTRWLSLQKVVSRTLHHWDALSSYFNSHDQVESDGKIHRLAHLLKNPEVKMYFYYLEFILVPLNDFNTTFQADATKIGIIHSQMIKLLRKFLAKFVQASIIAQHKDITKVPYDERDKQLSNDILAVGSSNRTFLIDHADDLSPFLLDKFFSIIREFYMAVTKKMLQKFPFHDDALKNMAFLNPEFKEQLVADCVLKLAKRFPQILGDTCSLDELQEEFLDYQLTPKEELPPADLGADKFWSQMAKVMEPFSNKSRFGLLAKLALACCVIPVSNADPERIFSMLKKIQTDMRSDLNNDTICSLICSKQNQDVCCFEYKPSDEVLKAAKQAVVAYQQSLIANKDV